MKTRFFRLSNGNMVDLNVVTKIAKIACKLRADAFDSIKHYSKLFDEVYNYITFLDIELKTNVEIDDEVLLCYNLLVEDSKEENSLGGKLLYNAILCQLFTNYFIIKNQKDELTLGDDIYTQFAKLTVAYNDLVEAHLFIDKEDNNERDKYKSR